MHIMTENGEVFYGTAEAIVSEMARSERFQTAKTITATLRYVYMNQTAQRVRLWCGEKIRTTTPAVFLEDLCEVGLFTRIHEDAITCTDCEE